MSQFKEIEYLESIVSLLWWDTETLLPKDSHDFREEQISVLTGKIHELKTKADYVEQIFNEKAPKDDVEVKQIAKLKKSTSMSTAFDADFVKRQSKAQLNSQRKWVEARKSNDFNIVKGALKEVVDMQIESAQRLKVFDKSKKYYEGKSDYDVLLDQYEPGLDSKWLTDTFEKLATGIKDRVPGILERQKENSVTREMIPIDKDIQVKMNNEILGSFGFNLNGGKLSESEHPFCGGHPLDVRLSTRYFDKDGFNGFLSTVHECGHALYEQNLPKEYLMTPCGHAASMGVHESQSRFYENQITRSEAFVSYLATKTKIDEKKIFNYFRSVEPGFIRVDADEVFYNLHIMIRTKLERDLILGQLKVEDLPDAWNAEFEKYFPLKVPSNKLGCLQDTHWYCGLMGYFPTYSMGNLLAAELFIDFKKEHQDWESKVSLGDFGFIKEFMSQKVYKYAAFDDSPHTISKILDGRELSETAFLSYLDERY